MSDELHPHWTSIGSSDTASEQKVEELIQKLPAEKGKRIRINRGGHSSTLFSHLLIAFVSIAVVGSVFYVGVNVLQADLTERMVPDIQIVLTSKGFDEVTVSPGNLVELSNATDSADTIRSLQNDADGIPVVALSIAPGSTVKFRIPDGMGGGQITLVSTIDPTRRGVLRVSGAIEQQALTAEKALLEQKEPEISNNNNQKVSLPVVESAQVAVSHPVATVPSSAISTALVPTPTPVLNLGSVAAAAQGSLWPSALRINQYVAGSSFAPAFSPTQQIPIHTVRQTQEQVHAASRITRPPASTQPSTGPELWVIVGLTILGVVMLLRTKKRA
jgi:hypothetical protein